MRRPALIPLLALLLALPHAGGCGAAQSSATSEPAATEGVQGLLEPFRVISPSEPVPQFQVVDTTGVVHDSRKILGSGPLVLSFFASWCASCAVKAPLLNDSLKTAPAGTQVLGVSLDDDSTWQHVEEYTRRHQLEFPIVRGAQFANFALAFDPMGAVPAIVVVGVDGYITDFQLGVRRGDRARLGEALELASKPAASSEKPQKPRVD